VNLDPTIGAEIKKLRPAVVVSSDFIGRLPLKLVAPITEWNESFSKSLWHVKIVPNGTNGLDKISAVDTLQLRGIDIKRFVTKFGVVSATDMEEITSAIVAVIEYQVR
jgi:mRNA interferase MazF